MLKWVDFLAALADSPPCLLEALLFHLYGLILRECPSMEQVQCHLASLLELSHQHSSYREVGQSPQVIALCLPHAPFTITRVLCASQCMAHFASLTPVQPPEDGLDRRTSPRELDKDLPCHL